VADVQLLVEPQLSRKKFERELTEYRRLQREHMARGWWMLDAEWPQVFIVFASSRLKPPAVIFGAIVDFTNYDFWPPSVTLVDPFSRQPYRAKELPTVMKRRKLTAVPPHIAAVAEAEGGEIPQLITDQPLLQSYGPDEIPFLCVPGVREYHHHPGHSGDSWLLHRGTGVGRLFFVLDVLHRYGVQPIDGYNVQMVPRIGFGESEVPE